jgi:hypothetical protein
LGVPGRVKKVSTFSVYPESVDGKEKRKKKKRRKEKGFG